MRIIRTKKWPEDKKRTRLNPDESFIGDKTCRVCKGTRKMKTSYGDTKCFHCDEDGNAKVGCGDCGEVLPGCRCVRMMGHCLPPEERRHVDTG